MGSNKLDPQVQLHNSTQQTGLSTADLDRLADFFSILITIDRRVSKSKENHYEELDHRNTSSTN